MAKITWATNPIAPGGRFAGGKLIHQRSTDYGTESDLSLHQH